jgi:hypothetical protein
VNLSPLNGLLLNDWPEGISPVTGLSFDESLVAALRADSAITAIVTGRIHPDSIHQKSTVPALVYEVSDDKPVRGLAGAMGPQDVAFSVWCVSEDRSVSKELADAVQSLLDERQGVMGGAGGVIVQRCQLMSRSYEDWEKGDGRDRPWRVVALSYDGRYREA